MNKKLRILMYSALAIVSLMNAGYYVAARPIFMLGELVIGIRT